MTNPITAMLDNDAPWTDGTFRGMDLRVAYITLTTMLGDAGKVLGDRKYVQLGKALQADDFKGHLVNLRAQLDTVIDLIAGRIDAELAEEERGRTFLPDAPFTMRTFALMDALTGKPGTAHYEGRDYGIVNREGWRTPYFPADTAARVLIDLCRAVGNGARWDIYSPHSWRIFWAGDHVDPQYFPVCKGNIVALTGLSWVYADGDA